MLPDILLTTIIISAFCVGWYHITREGAIFGFLGMYYEKIDDAIIYWKNQKEFVDSHNLKIKYQLATLRVFILKPIIGCCKCMASFWGFLVYYSLHGLQWQVVICCIAAAFTNVLFLKWSE